MPREEFNRRREAIVLWDGEVYRIDLTVPAAKEMTVSQLACEAYAELPACYDCQGQRRLGVPPPAPDTVPQFGAIEPQALLNLRMPRKSARIGGVYASVKRMPR